MSNSPEPEFDLELHFLPAWAQKSPEINRYADHPGDRGEARGDRRERRRRPEGPRREGPRRDGPRGNDRRPEGNRRGGQRDERMGRGRPGGPREERPKPLPLPELDVAIIPDDRGVESLSKQIRMTGRAYPLFEIAQMILKRPERHLFRFNIKKNAEGQPIQPLFLCALDDSLWLNEEDAVRHILENHFDTFYQTQKTKTEPPKGTYTFVAQCGMSGVILGPPNHHDYQNQLRKLHAERFSRMPFEAFKARIKIVRDEAVVKQWLEDQSYKTEFICLNMPDPLTLPNRQAVEKHFRETHLPSIVTQVESHQMPGTSAQKLRCPGLLRLVRHTYDQQRRFPLQIATVLSHQFAEQGLQFFKVNKSVTHVAVARPHFLDLEAAPVSDSVKQIVNYINGHPRCSRRQLLEGLLPGSTAPVAAPVVQPAATPSAEPQSGQPNAGPTTAAAAPEPAQSIEPSPEQTAIIADLHWLIHQGHVIEFANGSLETAKKPLPKPPREPKAKPAKPEAIATEGESAAAPAESPLATTDESGSVVGESAPPAEEVAMETTNAEQPNQTQG